MLMADEFFDDEEELMEEGARPRGPVPADRERGPRKDGDSGKGAYTRTPPPFWMVLVIAAIALLLGIVIGYLAGSASTLQALSASESQSQQQMAASDDPSAYELPEGHPQVEVDEDGTAHVSGGSDSSSSDAAADSQAAE